MRTLGLHSLIFVLVAGCGGGGGGSSDGGKAAGSDLAMAPVDAAEAGDLAALLPGTRVVSGTGITLGGVTSDGYAVYTDGDDVLWTVKLSGGNPTMISDDWEVYAIDGRAVFIWHNATDNEGNGPLAVWTAGSGRKELSKASAAGLAATSADGAWIAYFDKLNMAATVADLVVDKPDHSAAKSAVPGVFVASLNCGVDMGFAGARLLIASCPLPGDGGVASATVRTVDPATGKATDLLKGAEPYWVVDNANTKVLVVTEAGVASVLPIAGGNPLASNIAAFDDGLFTPDGSAVIYRTTTKSLNRVAATGGTPTTLVKDVVAAIEAVTPDGKTAAFSTRDSGDPDYLVDVRLVGTTAGAMPSVVVPNPTALIASGFGDAFTDDSRHLLYFTDLAEAGDTGYAVASLSVHTVGGAGKPLAQKIWLASAVGGGRVVYNDNYRAVPDLDGRGDLQLVDLNAGATPALLVTQADVNFALSPDKKQLVYTWNLSASRAGLYVTTIP